MADFNKFQNLREPVNGDSETPKIARVLFYLCCGDSLTRFEAEREVHDHALNSTISILANDYGICPKLARATDQMQALRH